MNRIISGLMLWAIMVSAALANAIDKNCPQFTAYGSPQATFAPNTQFLCRKNYAVIHDCAVKNPVAVMEHISQEDIAGNAKRQDDFREDPEVIAACRSRMSDYQASGYDRGHMSAAGNNTQSEEVMSESFLLSNMVPQVPNNNRGIWRILESQVRDEVADNKHDVYVISGGIFDRGHRTIGNNVAVPTRLYKIIINKKTNTVTAYLMPNDNLPVADLPKYRVSVEEVERATGMKFKVKP